MTETAQPLPTLRPDICVIGAGSGGLSVAAAAAMFGVTVVLVEKGAMGGDCLNVGCVPSKALIAAGAMAATMRQAPRFGVGGSEPTVNMARVRDHVRDVIDRISPNDSVERFRALGVTVLQGEARFTSPQTVLVGDQVIQARRFVLATGSRPAIPPIPGLETVPYLTNESVFDLSRKVEHLIVLGGGPVGVELAQAHRRLGARVTVIDEGPLLSREDPELVRHVVEALQREGVSIRSMSRIEGVAPRGDGLALTLVGSGERREEIVASHLLIATGRNPVVDGLGLEAAGIAVDADGIRVDRRLRTTNSRVYAIGDCASTRIAGPRLTHMANHHAGIVLRAILFRARGRIDPDKVPRVTFTEPEIAAVGLTEAIARERHGRIGIARWPFAENDRAQADRATAGEIKVVTDRRGRILGCHIVGVGAGELITPWTMAVGRRLRLRDMANVVMPYPTRSEVARRVAIASLQPLTQNPWLRRLIRFLRLFG